MSDFFSDDFTAELKSYFLDNLILEIDKNIDLVDDKLWTRIYGEVKELTKSWAIDAKTNEFQYLGSWLDGYSVRYPTMESARDLVRSLEYIKEYAKALKEHEDCEELSARFSNSVGGQKQNLFLLCLYGQQDFAIPLLNVIEITSDLPLYNLPQKKFGLLGVIPFRGEAIPVVSFQDYGFYHEQMKKACYIICEADGEKFSLQVTKTDDLVSLKESDIQEIDGSQGIIPEAFVKQFFIKNEKNVMILDIQKMVAA